MKELALCYAFSPAFYNGWRDMPWHPQRFLNKEQHKKKQVLIYVTVFVQQFDKVEALFKIAITVNYQVF